MDRFAVFVDAGYLFAAGGMATCGSPARSRFAFDATGFVDALLAKVRSSSRLPLLRTYWYDGARNGVPTDEQRAIASLPDVKLRLGRLNSENQQKGVDALIYHDLNTLAWRGAIAEAFVLSGDEDLREGVRAAQGLGVRVGLIGIDGGGRPNQSKELCAEADVNLRFAAGDVAPFFRPASVTPPGPTSGSLPDHRNTGGLDAPDLGDVVRCGRAYGERWASSATEDEIAAIGRRGSTIPRVIDAALLRYAEEQLGRSLRGQRTARHELRRAFREAVARSRRSRGP